MNVLHITSKSLGGSGKYITVLANGIKDSFSDECNIDLCYYNLGCQQDVEIEAPFGEVYHFNQKPSLNPLVIFRNIRQLQKIINKNDYDVIHTHTSLGGVIGRLATFFSSAKPKVIHTLHAYGADEFTPVPQKWVYWLVEKILDYITDAYVSPSQYMIDYGKRIALINKKKAFVIHNSLPLIDPVKDEVFQQRQLVRNKLSIQNDELLLLFCGRLEKQKGVDVLLRAISLIPDKFKFKLAICGTGDLEDSLKILTKELNIESRVIWCGWQSQLDSYYAASDVYIMPSRWESFGLVFLEAMNYSKPILASNTQAIPEVVADRVCGLLSDNESSEGLAENLITLLENESLRIQFGYAGKEILNSKFNFKKFVSKNVELYRYLLNKD